MIDVVFELLLPDVPAEKLGQRGISVGEAGQLPRNVHITTHNPAGGPDRRLLIGRTDGGRALTLVIERTLEPTTWLVVTGWIATNNERKMIDHA